MPYDSLQSISTLAQNEKLTSDNGLYIAILQLDGNFVLYENSSTPVWATSTNVTGTDPRRLTVQYDGNVVIYDGENVPLWNTGTNGMGTSPFTFIMQNDRNLVLYDSSGTPLWASNTSV